MAKRRSRPPADPCPSCSSPLEKGFCRGCGWDNAVNRGEDSYLDDVDLPTGWGPEDEEPKAASEGIPPIWRAVALIIVLVFAWGLLQSI
jgi:hypothetical protein